MRTGCPPSSPDFGRPGIGRGRRLPRSTEATLCAFSFRSKESGTIRRPHPCHTYNRRCFRRPSSYNACSILQIAVLGNSDGLQPVRHFQGVLLMSFSMHS